MNLRTCSIRLARTPLIAFAPRNRSADVGAVEDPFVRWLPLAPQA